jgi:hypothetical protein
VEEEELETCQKSERPGDEPGRWRKRIGFGVTGIDREAEAASSQWC